MSNVLPCTLVNYYKLMDTITFSDLCDELYNKTNRKEQPNLKISKDTRKNFMSKNLKYFNEILQALRLEDYKSYLKENRQAEGSGYAIPKESKNFIIDILENYSSDELLALRQGHFEKVSDRWMVKLYEGFYILFEAIEGSAEVINEIGESMALVTDYPIRVRHAKKEQFTYQLESLVDRAFWQRWRSTTTPSDNCAWLDAMEADLQLFMDKWEYIFNYMGEVRQEELNDMAVEDVKKLSNEEARRALLEFQYSEGLDNEYENDEKLAALKKERQKEIIEKKTGNYREKEDMLEYINKLIHRRMEKLFCEYMHENGIDNVGSDTNTVNTEDFSNMKSSEQVLTEAIQDYKESTVPIPKVELPELDIEKILADFHQRQKYRKLK